MCFRHALAQQFQASLGKVDNLAFIVVINSVGLRFDLSLGNLLDHVDNFVRLSDLANQRLVLGLEKLEECPYGDVLERGVSAGQESTEVTVNAAVGFCPVLDEDGIVAN